MLSKIQKTVVSYKLRSATHTDEITIENHRRWNHLGKMVSNRTIKKQKRVWLKPNLVLANPTR
jgi:transketolase C-terminal domain/subunit